MKKYEEPLDIMCHKVDYTGVKIKDCNIKGLSNAHTHGLEEYGEPNLCLGIDLSLERTQYILNSVAELLCDTNREFNRTHAHSVCDENDKELFRFFLVPAFCCDDYTSLIVLADKNNKFPQDKGCENTYAKQLTSHHEIEVLPTNKGKIDVDKFTDKQKDIMKNIMLNLA